VTYRTLGHDYEHLVPVVDGRCATGGRGAGSAFGNGRDAAEGLVGGQLEFRGLRRGPRPNPRLERRAGRSPGPSL